MNPAQMHNRLRAVEQALINLGRNPGLRGMGGPDDAMAAEEEAFMSKRRDFYTYVANSLALAGATSAIVTINIEADSNFVLQKLAQFSDIALAVETDSSRVLPLVTITIQDTGSGRQLMQNPVPIPSLFGTGPLPFVLQNPRIFMRNTTIQLTLTNLTAATTYNIRLAFIGYKIYGTA